MGTEALLDLVRARWRVSSGRGNDLHRTMNVRIREDDGHRCMGHAPAVMGSLSQDALNMGRTVQQNFRPDLSIGLRRDRIGRRPWILATALP